MGQLTYTRRTDNAPEPDGPFQTVVKAKIRHYRQMYLNRPDPIAFMPVAVDTSDRVYDDLVDYFFYMLTVKLQLWLMRYRKNRSNFDFFGRLVMIILRDQ
jgi:hypothetical protein